MDYNGSPIETTKKIETINKGPILGVRHLQAALIFLNFSLQYMNRVHVALTLVIMTNANKSNPNFPEYSWNEKQKSYILSSFYWGFFIAQFPGAYCSRRYGVKISLLLYTLVSGLSSLLVPFCVPWGGWQAFCVLRFMQGLSQGVYPCCVQHLAKWSPPVERGLLSCFAHTGFELGTISAMLLSGYIGISPLGWPGIFYILAALCFVWCVLWQLFGANDVTTSKFIGKEEQLYIENALKNSVSFEKSRLPVPWRAIFSSKPFYALLMAAIGADVGLVVLQTEWPAYMNGILKMNIENNALYSALPSVAAWLSSYVFAFIENFIRKRNLLSITASRKCFNSFSMWISAVGTVLIGFLDKTNEKLIVIIMFIVMAAYNGIYLGCTLNPIDLAPNHTDIIVSILFTVSSSVDLLGPLYVGVIVTDEENREQWKIAFITTAAIFCIGDLAFLIWGSAKKQSWNAADYRNKTPDKELVSLNNL